MPTKIKLIARGPAGSGKSTMLDTIVRLLSPYRITYEPSGDEHTLLMTLPDKIADGINRDARGLQSIVSDQMKQADEAEKKLDFLRDQHTQEQQKRLAAEKERDAAREQFADLKRRLHDAELSLARRDGYIDRVRDLERPQPVEERTESRRTLTPSYGTNDGSAMNAVRGLSGAMREVRAADGAAPRHWTSYGN